MKYNKDYKILFRFDPWAQAVVGGFDGYMLVLDLLTDCIEVEEAPKDTEFTYTQSKWNALIKFIITNHDKVINERRKRYCSHSIPIDKM